MVQKLKVATRSGVAQQKHNKILQCMSAYPEGTTPKNIAVQTGLNVNTVKSILPLLKSVKRVTRGWYKIVEGGDGTLPSQDDLSDWNFHNLVLSCPFDNSVALEESGSYDFQLGRADLSFGPSKATFRISSDFPLNVSSISFVALFFSELLGVKFSDVLVSTVEFNRDFSNLRLDGLKSLSVDSLISQFKLYQKNRGLRVEHKTKVPIPVASIVDMLSQDPRSVDVLDKLNDVHKTLDILSTQTRMNTSALMNVGGKIYD